MGNDSFYCIRTICRPYAFSEKGTDVTYFLNLFSAETWSSFQAAGSKLSGFSRHQRTRAQRALAPGDVFICYLVGLGRWCGALKVESAAFIDETPLFRDQIDPFIVRFHVTPVVMLQPEFALPVREANIWNTLSWTRDIPPGSVGWGANFQSSLRQIPDEDAHFLMQCLNNQAQNPHLFELTTKDRRRLNRAATVRTAMGDLTVDIPDGDDEAETPATAISQELIARESHQIQSLVAEIGSKLGFKIWLPRSDRERVKPLSAIDLASAMIDVLPMNYNDATIRTIEQIDVIWLRGRSIARAFEVEHTTSIYSGLLRMADLVASSLILTFHCTLSHPRGGRNRCLSRLDVQYSVYWKPARYLLVAVLLRTAM